ncbi:MAG: TRAP transporter substrate-binding protein [Paracoccaceae bacterium]
MRQRTKHKTTRRAVLTGAPLALATTLAAPAIAQSTRTIRMATSWPPSLGGLGTGAQRIADSINQAFDGRLTVELHSAGKLVAPLGVHDAAQAGEIEMYHSAEYYWQKKHRAFNFFTTVPLGMTTVETISWIRNSDGQQLWDELNAQFNVKALPVGTTGVQMGGWFDKTIESVEDFEGLTMRMPGLGGQVLKDIGANAVVLPGGGIVEALFDKSIDATEWVGPYNDSQFGFQKLLTTYMYPGFHEPSTMASLGMNLEFWNSLSPEDQALIQLITDAELSLMTSDFLGNNALSLTQLIDEFGVEPTPLPDDLWDALSETSLRVVASVADDDELAKRIFESYDAHRSMCIGATAFSQSEYLARRKADDLFQFI